MLNFKKPFHDLPECSTALFAHLRKIKAKTIGDAYRAAGDEATPDFLKKQLFAIFRIKKFDPKLLDGVFAETPVVSVMKSLKTSVEAERVRKIRFDDLALGKEIRAALTGLWIDTLGEFSNAPAETFRGHDFPIEYLVVVNEILKKYGLPEKLVDGLKKRFP